MKTMMIVVMAALLGAAAMAEARLFETEAECEARYGKPIKKAEVELPATKAWSYNKNGIFFSIQFVEGRAWCLDFSHLKHEQKKLVIEANLAALGGRQQRQLTDGLKPSLVSAEEKKAQEHVNHDLSKTYPRGEVIELKVNYWGLRIVAKDWKSLGATLRAQRTAKQAQGF